MKQVTRGNEMMLFLDGQSLALATSHTLTVTADTVDISTKDHGYWGASDIGNMSFEITSENLYVDTDYDKLFDAMLQKEPIDAVWGKAKNYDENGLGDSDSYWDAPEDKYYTGKVVITSLTQNANTGENVTYSVTLTGHGAIQRIDGSSNVTSLNP